MTKRVGLYARVSGKNQEDNTSLDNQIMKCRKFALEHHFEIVAKKKEVVTGASRWGARTKFNDLLKMGDQGLLDAIVVDKKDRLARGRAIATLLDRAEKHGLEVLFVDGSGIDDVSLGVSIITSGVERNQIGQRTKEGKLRSAEKGNIIFSCAPYGYEIVRIYDQHTGKKIDASVEFEPEEVQIAVSMFEWLVYEYESLQGIVNRLYAAQILPKHTRRKLVKDFGEVLPWDEIPDIRDERGRPKYDKVWQRSTIQRILSNEVYTGRWYFNRRITARVEKDDRMCQVILGVRDKSEWVCVNVPPAVPDDLFEEAQKVFRKNKELQSGRPSKYQLLLRSLVFCPCGRRMLGAVHIKGYWADYRCEREKRPDEAKQHPRLHAKKADRVVWAYIESMMLKPEQLITEYEERQREQSERNTVLREQAEYLRADIYKGKVKLDRLLEVYLDSDIDRTTYHRKKKDIENATSDTENELTTVESQLEMEFFTDDDKARLLEFCADVQKKLTHATFEDKRQLLMILNVNVRHKPDVGKLGVSGGFSYKELSITGGCDRQFPFSFGAILTLCEQKAAAVVLYPHRRPVAKRAEYSLPKPTLIL